MNRKSFVLLPLLALLTGCISMNFEKTSHEEGLFDNGSKVNGNFSYSYFDGDSINESDYTSHLVTMRTDVSTVAISDKEVFNSYIVDNDSIISDVTLLKEIAKNPNGLRVGDAKNSLRGELTLTLSSPIKAVRISAYPFSQLREGLEDSVMIADTNVGLSVNGSAFIKLDSTLENEQAKLQTCDYVLSTPSEEFKLVVGEQRAVIKNITFYC